MAGVLTKTVIRSPVVRWILQARIRNRWFNDVVFVGDDFLYVKQVKGQGNLEHVATKTDFDARIRAAKTFSIEDPAEDADTFMKTENDEPSQDTRAVPPQCIALTTDRHELLFLTLLEDGAGAWRFVHRTCPLPIFDRVLFQPGEHLAVDPYSRALAVSANEREVVIYSAKSAQEIRSGFHLTQQSWCPVSTQRALQVDGVIQHMDFLIPSSDDEDHIILLFILADQRRTRAVWIDWYLGSDLFKAQIHPGQALDTARGLTNLLVPLRNASFFLISGTDVKRWTNILCGSATGSDVPLLDVEPVSAGESPRKPVWVNWCRPRRAQGASDGADHLYLVREDGIICLVQASSIVLSHHAGDLQCHVGTAFASLGDDRDPDILIAGGDMSSGRICSIGHWSTLIRVPDMNRPDTMIPHLVQIIPNWASVTDMVTATLHDKTQRPRDGIFVTSGRQPYGTITELRKGLEARSATYFELEELRSVTDIWVLPLVAVGEVLVLLSNPTGTRFLQASTDADMQSIHEIEGSSLALDSGHSTLAAAFTEDGNLVQITRHGIRVSPGTSINFEDTASIECDDGSTILAAAINARGSVAVTAMRTETASIVHELVVRSLEADAMDISASDSNSRILLQSEPLSIAVLDLGASTIVLVATSDGYLHAFPVDSNRNCATSSNIRLPASPGGDPGWCDSIAILRSERLASASGEGLLIVCGLRDGRLCLVSSNLEKNLQLCWESNIDFALSAVKLTQHPEHPAVAYAMKGSDLCLLSWDGESPAGVNIENIWISDKSRPELAQGPVVACAHMPPAHLLASPKLGGSLVIVSGDECIVTFLEHHPTSVPRQIPVSGTPNRLIYAEHQRHLVCASIRYGIDYFSPSLPQTKPEERRQMWPVIDFVPSRSDDSPYSYEMQPGEHVYALLEWTLKLGEGKTYSFVLVGGSYTKSTGSVRGRITFLQPVYKNWSVIDVKEAQRANFDEAVYAIALLDDITYVACVGKSVIVNRFSIDDRKWVPICMPFKLASRGVCITTQEASILISTAQDGFVRLQLQESRSTTESGISHSHVLVGGASTPRADALLSHCSAGEDDATHVMTTKHGRLIGIDPYPSRHGETTSTESFELLFDAHLPRSLTRLRYSYVRPRWKNYVFPKVTGDLMIGCAPDGTIVGVVAVTDTDLLRRLSWLQRLCEWNENIAPHIYISPPYRVTETSSAKERALPIGLSTGSVSRNDMIMLQTNRGELCDKHVDGDVLERLLEKGGSAILKDIIQETSNRDDRVGEWMRRHLLEELESVDGIIDILKKMLDAWL